MSNLDARIWGYLDDVEGTFGDDEAADALRAVLAYCDSCEGAAEFMDASGPAYLTVAREIRETVARALGVEE